MGVPAARVRRTTFAVAVPVGLVLSVALTWSSTHAAFTASTGNAGNSWQAGRVVLGDGDRGTALFDSDQADGALVPDDARSQCIRVDYTGDLDVDLRMYVGTPPGGAVTLDPYLVMSVERGEDVDRDTEVAADCSEGFTSTASPTYLYNGDQADGPAADALRTLAELKDDHGTHATGLVVNPPGTPVRPDSHLTFKVTYRVADDDDAQGAESTATFTWEAHNR